MRLRDADRFSEVDSRLLTAVSKRDCKAPKVARWLLTLARAESRIFSASFEPETVYTSMLDTELSVAGPAATPLPAVTVPNEKPLSEFIEI